MAEPTKTPATEILKRLAAEALERQKTRALDREKAQALAQQKAQALSQQKTQAMDREKAQTTRSSATQASRKTEPLSPQKTAQLTRRQRVQRLFPAWVWLAAGFLVGAVGVAPIAPGFRPEAETRPLGLLNPPAPTPASELLRPEAPPVKQPSPVEARRQAILSLGYTEAQMDEFYAPSAKPFAGPGSYSIVFVKPPDDRLVRDWQQAGVSFAFTEDGVRHAGVQADVLSEDAYRVLGNPDVDCIRFCKAVKSEPKRKDPNSWRISEGTPKDRSE